MKKIQLKLQIFKICIMLKFRFLNFAKSLSSKNKLKLENDAKTSVTTLSFLHRFWLVFLHTSSVKVKIWHSYRKANFYYKKFSKHITLCTFLTLKENIEKKRTKLKTHHYLRAKTGGVPGISWYCRIRSSLVSP